MANIPQWKVGDVLSASKLNAMVDAINDLLADQTGSNDVYITLDELNDILKQYSDIGHTHNVNEIVDLVLPTKLSQLQNDTSYVTEDYVINAIANAQLGGDGEADLSAYATKNYVDSEIEKIELTPGPQGEQGIQGEKGEDGLTTSIIVNGSTFVHQNGVITLPDYPEVNPSIDTYTKEEIDGIVDDYSGGKKQRYITQDEYDQLDENEKNDNSIVYNIIDATDTVIPCDLQLSDNLLTLIDGENNTIGVGITLPSNVSGSSITDDEVYAVLTSVFGEEYIPGDDSGDDSGDIVDVPCTDLQLTQTSLSLNIGDIVEITASPIPSNTTDEIIWSSSNDNCTVVDGVVTAVKAGDCVITATCGKYSATCAITVLAAEEPGEPEVPENAILNYDFANVSNSTTVVDLANNNNGILTAACSSNSDGALALNTAGLTSTNNVTLDNDFTITMEISCNNANGFLCSIGDISNTKGKYFAIKNSYGTIQAMFTDTTAQKYNQVNSISGTSYTTEYHTITVTKIGTTMTLYVNDAEQATCEITADIFPLSEKVRINRELRDDVENNLNRQITIKTFQIL